MEIHKRNNFINCNFINYYLKIQKWVYNDLL